MHLIFDSRHRSRCWIAAVMLLLSTFPAAAQPLVLDAVTPAEGIEGDLFLIQGSGFGSSPATLSVLIGDGETAATAEVLSASPNELLCRLEAAGSTTPGDIQVRLGTRTFIPDWTLDRGHYAYLVTGSSLLEAQSTASGLSYSPLEAGTGTAAARQSGSGLIIDLIDIDPLIPAAAVSVIETGCPTGGSTSEGPTAIPPIHTLTVPGTGGVLVARLEMQLVYGSSTAIARETFAVDLATAIQLTFGGFGLTASAVGGEILITRQDCGAPAPGAAFLKL